MQSLVRNDIARAVIEPREYWIFKHYSFNFISNTNWTQAYHQTIYKSLKLTWLIYFLSEFELVYKPLSNLIYSLYKVNIIIIIFS